MCQVYEFILIGNQKKRKKKSKIVFLWFQFLHVCERLLLLFLLNSSLSWAPYASGRLELARKQFWPFAMPVRLCISAWDVRQFSSNVCGKPVVKIPRLYYLDNSQIYVIDNFDIYAFSPHDSTMATFWPMKTTISNERSRWTIHRQ